jgi:hypothetical protein
MPERFSDQQLDAVLASVGRHLVVPTGSPVVLRCRRRFDATTGSPRC